MVGGYHPDDAITGPHRRARHPLPGRHVWIRIPLRRSDGDLETVLLAVRQRCYRASGLMRVAVTPHRAGSELEPREADGEHRYDGGDHAQPPESRADTTSGSPPAGSTITAATSTASSTTTIARLGLPTPRADRPRSERDRRGVRHDMRGGQDHSRSDTVPEPRRPRPSAVWTMTSATCWARGPCPTRRTRVATHTPGQTPPRARLTAGDTNNLPNRPLRHPHDTMCDGADDDHGASMAVDYAELVAQLRTELTEAMQEGRDETLRFGLGPVELELTVKVTKDATPERGQILGRRGRCRYKGILEPYSEDQADTRALPGRATRHQTRHRWRRGSQRKVSDHAGPLRGDRRQ